MPIRRVNSAIYEAPATQKDQLFTQLKKKNAKTIPKKLIAYVYRQYSSIRIIINTV